MSETCKERCVGHIMSCAISSNGLSTTTGSDEHNKIVERFLLEAAKVKTVYAKEIAELAQARKEGRVTEDMTEVVMPSDPQARQNIIDRGAICIVMCCCNKNPSSGASGQNLKQGCAHEVFQEADKALGYKSRYKSELSWNMNKASGEPPVPLMHRDSQGNNTTEPSRFWHGRKQEVDGYVPNAGYIRRPDLVIVSDSNQPPSQDTIDSVMEFKFGDDKHDIEQNEAYKEIAGDREKYAIWRVGGKKQKKKELGCNCKSPQRTPD